MMDSVGYQTPEIWRFVRRYPRGYARSHNNYFPGGTLGVPLPNSGESSRTDGRVVHKLTRGFGMRREEPAPFLVVLPAAGRHTATVPERKPLLHVCFGHPHPLTASVLGEYGDVGQEPMVHP